MIECIIDAREQSLWALIQEKPLSIPTRTEMLPLGDIIIQKTEGEILLMIERKTVADLVGSLKDGRYHDQRKRWLEFMENSPNSNVSLWIEGDLLSASMENVMRSSLMNSILRLQSKHKIIVYNVRTKEGFVRSLQMAIEKFEKDPYHLVANPSGNENPITTSMNRYKKSAQSGETYWHDCLCLVPGVSSGTSSKIVEIFPSLVEFIDALKENKEKTEQMLSQIQTSSNRKLGPKTASKIIFHITSGSKTNC